MLRVATFILMTLAVSRPALARLGETLEQCEARYGVAVEKRAALMPGSEAEAVVFSKSSITVVAEFREGKVWHISFRKPGLSMAEMDALLEANAGSGPWSMPLKSGGGEHRMGADKDRLAVILLPRKEAAGTVTIMSRECIRAQRVRLLQQAEAISLQAEKGGPNPLPGF